MFLSLIFFVPPNHWPCSPVFRLPSVTLLLLLLFIYPQNQCIETDTHFYLVLEYAPGGELFDYIVARDRLKEDEARAFFREIVAAVAYCHTQVQKKKKMMTMMMMMMKGEKRKQV